ncbi:MAG: branched-chain amino acid ABC transporter substrate-binding protein [Actinomycetospora chiangmaiensis]|nr:branched-chain amino acid ABC transporter substrate-binding protein [Actinomycetospora chiangmaiensis]
MPRPATLLPLLALLAVPAQARADDLTIAMVGPMTGPNASIGEQMKHGAELAADALNKKGGVLGKTVKIAVEDDGCDPKQAVSVANRVEAAGTRFVDGHACSGASIPASAIYGEAGILMMTPASSNPKLTEDAATHGWPTILRLYGRDDAQGAFIGPWIAKHFGSGKIAVLHDKSAYGKGLADNVKAGLEKAGVTIAEYQGINAGEKDYRAVVSRLKGEGATFLYFGGYATEGGLIKRQAADAGYDLQMMMGDAIATPDFWTAAGPAGQGTLFTFPPDGRESPEARDALEQFKQIGFTPEGFTLFSYAVVQTIAGGVQKAGSTDPGKVAAALRAGTVPTVFGPVGFDAKGDIQNPHYNINQWKDGAYAKLPSQD